MHRACRVQAAIGALLAAVIPRARVVAAVRPEDMNTDAACVREYVEDPLNTIGNLAARTGYEGLNAMQRLRRRWPEFEVPIFALHGCADKCTSHAATRAFVEAAASKDKVIGHWEQLGGKIEGEVTEAVGGGVRPARTSRAGLALGLEKGTWNRRGHGWRAGSGLER